jgi:Flp pilus assembly pilin Flp
VKESTRARRRWSGGQGLIEYGMALILVAVVVMIALFALGGQYKNLYSSASHGINNAASH